MDITEPELLSELNTRHAHAVDKHYRMWAGLSSHLLSYQDGIITLQIHHTDRWPKSPEVTARQLANSWRRFNPELQNAHGYRVYIQHSQKETGYATIARGKSKEQLADELFEGIQRMHRAQRQERVGQLLNGRFDEE